MYKLRKHISAVHEKVKRFPCLKCESGLSQKNKLQRHIDSVHEKKTPHKCTICNDEFTEKKQ